jgi:type VI secretion system secreted protein Hcp
MAVDMFLKIEGINGESQDSVHAKEIDILAWSWGVSNSGSAHTGGGAGSGKANFEDISFTKFVDLSSTHLMLACANGKHITKATLVCRKAGEKPLEYLTIVLENILVSDYKTGGTGSEERLTENFSMNFAKMSVNYKEQAKTGGSGLSGDFKWDISKNVKL